VKQSIKEAKAIAMQNSFELIAIEWHKHKKPNWSSGYADDILESLRKDIFPFVGKRAITDIKPIDMLAVLKKLEERGVLDKLKKYDRPVSKYSLMQLLPAVLNSTRLQTLLAH
jgi:integrase